MQEATEEPGILLLLSSCSISACLRTVWYVDGRGEESRCLIDALSSQADRSVSRSPAIVW